MVGVILCGLALAEAPPETPEAAPSPWAEVIEEPARGPAPLGDPDALPLAGWRVRPVGGPSAVALGGLAVVGGTGGTQVVTLAARTPVRGWQLGVRLPFAAYRAPESHDTGLGNLTLEAWIPTGRGEIGLEFGAPIGPHAWTWAYDSDDVWPATGGAVIYQSGWQRRGWTIHGRTSLGYYQTPDYAPFPERFARLEGAVMVDRPVVEGVAVVAEGSLATWDRSPLDVVFGARVDPVPGVRVRGGLLVPISLLANDYQDVGLTLDLTLGM